MVKNQPAAAGDTGSIPSLGRSHMLQSNQARSRQTLTLCSSAREPQLLKLACPRACALQQEKPPQCEAGAPQLESRPCSLQPEKSLHSIKDLAQPQINTYIILKYFKKPIL